MRHSIHKKSHDAYLHALRSVWYEPEFSSAPRGLPVREVLDYSFTITEPTSESIITLDEERNQVIADYTAKETELYNSCSNQVEDFVKASKFWEKLANPDGTVNSAYGYLIWKKKSHGSAGFELGANTRDVYFNAPEFIAAKDRCFRTPWEWCVDSLKQDKDTRQAVMKFSLPEHHWLGVKDFTCTLHGNWLIRNDKLYLTITMRSNDLMKGLVYDLPWFISLMDRMIEELKPTYPSLTKGTYTHVAHSMHAYEKDGPAILKMLGEK